MSVIDGIEWTGVTSEPTAEEEALVRELWELQERVGPDDPILEPLLLDIAELSATRGQLPRARALVRRVHRIHEARGAVDDPRASALVDTYRRYGGTGARSW